MSDTIIVPIDRRRPSVERRAYRPSEVAEAYALSESYVRNEVAAGRLPGHKVGRRWLILREDVEAWIRGKVAA